ADVRPRRRDRVGPVADHDPAAGGGQRGDRAGRWPHPVCRLHRRDAGVRGAEPGRRAALPRRARRRRQVDARQPRRGRRGGHPVAAGHRARRRTGGDAVQRGAAGPAVLGLQLHRAGHRRPDARRAGRHPARVHRRRPLRARPDHHGDGRAARPVRRPPPDPRERPHRRRLHLRPRRRAGGVPGGMTAPRAPRIRSVLWCLAPFAALRAVWAAVVAATGVPMRIFPQVPHAPRALVGMTVSGELTAHLAASLRRVLIGSVLAVVTALPFGIALGASPRLSAFFAPLLRFSVALAGIAWIPIATLWLGYGDGAVIFIVWNAMFFALAYNTMLGVRRIPLPLLRAARSMGTGRLRMFW